MKTQTRIKGLIVESPSNGNGCTQGAFYRVLSSTVGRDGLIWVQDERCIRNPRRVPASHFGL